MDDLARISPPHACIWPGNAGEFKDMKRGMLERKGYDIFDSVKEVALFAMRDADVTGEPFCNNNLNAAE